MSTRVLWLIASAIAAMFLAAPDAARAQATRTWVSGVGDDANPCSRTAPCKTFAGAISKTAAAGEINCLDPGGFGGVTITKSISIICDDLRGGVLVAGTNAIVINAAATDKVHLSGLNINGVNTGLSGIAIFQAQSVRIKNTLIHEFTTAGIRVAPSALGASIRLEVIDSVIADNPSTATGILILPTSNASVRATLDNVNVSRNGADGIAFDATQTTGSLRGVITESVFSGNTANGVVARSGGQTNSIMLDRISVFDNATGISATGAGALIRFTNSNVSGNALGVSESSSGSVLSFVNNAVRGNTNNGTFGTNALD